MCNIYMAVCPLSGCVSAIPLCLSPELLSLTVFMNVAEIRVQWLYCSCLTVFPLEKQRQGGKTCYTDPQKYSTPDYLMMFVGLNKLYCCSAVCCHEFRCIVVHININVNKLMKYYDSICTCFILEL